LGGVSECAIARRAARDLGAAERAVTGPPLVGCRWAVAELSVVRMVGAGRTAETGSIATGVPRAEGVRATVGERRARFPGTKVIYDLGVKRDP
jgi:hypothetical protein